MEPGRELDQLIAERVLGWAKVFWTYNSDDPSGGVGWEKPGGPVHTAAYLPRFSADIAAAWQVVEKLGPTFGLMRVKGLASWQAHFGQQGWTDGDTAPHAICLAALKACGVET